MNKAMEILFWIVFALGIGYFLITDANAAPYTLEKDVNNNYIITLENEIGSIAGYARIKAAIVKPKSITFVFKNNAGGYSRTALWFVDIIKEHKVPTQAIIEGKAASAAATIASFCDTIEMKKESYMMWHNGWNQNMRGEKYPQTKEQLEKDKVLWKQCKEKKLLTDEQINQIVNQRIKVYKLWNGEYILDFDREAP